MVIPFYSRNKELCCIHFLFFDSAEQKNRDVFFRRYKNAQSLYELFNFSERFEKRSARAYITHTFNIHHENID